MYSAGFRLMKLQYKPPWERRSDHTNHAEASNEIKQVCTDCRTTPVCLLYVDRALIMDCLAPRSLSVNHESFERLTDYICEKKWSLEWLCDAEIERDVHLTCLASQPNAFHHEPLINLIRSVKHTSHAYRP